MLDQIQDRLVDHESLVDLRNKVSHSGLDVAASLNQLDQLIGAKRRLLELQDKLDSALDRLQQNIQGRNSPGERNP